MFAFMAGAHQKKKGMRSMELSRRTLAIPGSVTLAIDAKAKALLAQGKDVVGFGAGEPDFPTPAYIVEAAKRALDQGYTKYTPAAGIPELRRAVCEKLKNENGLEYKPEQVVVSCGAKHSIFNVLQALCNPGDEVIIPAPFWVSYPEMVKMADGVPVFVRGDEANGFKMAAAALKAAITPKTKALILNSPNNPNGCVYSKEELWAIAKVCEDAGIFVISDEIYEHLIYGGKKHYSIAAYSQKLKEQTIVVNGVSKSYSMTGWRIGYTACRADIATMMTNYQSQSTSNPTSIAQYAALEALSKPCGELPAMRAEFEKRRDFLASRINETDGLSCQVPDGAFYIMMDLSAVLGKSHGGKRLDTPMEFAAALLESKLTAIVPGEAFGAEKYARLSYATGMAKIEKGIGRIAEFVAELE